MKNKQGNIMVITTIWLVCLLIIGNSFYLVSEIPKNSKRKSQMSYDSFMGQSVANKILNKLIDNLENTTVSLPNVEGYDSIIYDVMLQSANEYYIDSAPLICSDLPSLLTSAETPLEMQEMYSNFLADKSLTADIKLDSAIVMDITNPANIMKFKTGDIIYLKPISAVVTLKYGNNIFTYKNTISDVFVSAVISDSTIKLDVILSQMVINNNLKN